MIHVTFSKVLFTVMITLPLTFVILHHGMTLFYMNIPINCSAMHCMIAYLLRHVIVTSIWHVRELSAVSVVDMHTRSVGRAP